MGKKTKVGKARKDKFYRLAKETGFRSRAAFKLLQLNRKYGFLEKSRVCIDLCAAPGGWLQVAAQGMPVSSMILGVDLVPIKPIPGCTTFQEDITTEKCKQTLRKELQTWDADVVLNDGAPNVGKNWLHDAFQQAELTLHALKLATCFLRKGGWFVTKIFRSKDYNALLWAFQQLFKKVYATKPQASRSESAELFVVCQGYIKPDRLDPKFLDPRYVFKEVDLEPKSIDSLLHPTKKKVKAQGYAEGDNTLHHKIKVLDFIQADNHIQVLATANELELDDDDIVMHPLTTSEIKECCKDIKVLGKRDLRALLNWRKKMKEYLDLQNSVEGNVNETGEVVQEDPDEDKEEEEDTKLEQQIAELQQQETLEQKRKRKKVMKEKRKLRDRMSLNMVIPGDQMVVTDDINLFDLKKIKSKQGLQEVERREMEVETEEENSDSELPPKRMIAYDRFSPDPDQQLSEDESEGAHSMEEDAASTDGEEESQTDDENNEEQNPLLVDLETSEQKVRKKTQMWFEKDIFTGLEAEEDEDLEIEKMAEEYNKKGGTILKKISKPNAKRKHAGMEESEDSSDDEDDVNFDLEEKQDSEDSKDMKDEVSSSDSDSNSDGSNYNFSYSTKHAGMAAKACMTKSTKDGFEIVSAKEPAPKIRKLDPAGLALGEELIKSAKRRRELEEESFNRYTFNDESLPEWFVKDEERYNKRQLPVTKEQIEEYRQRLKAINARPIKKVAEAKARRKRKASKKLEKVRKKAETITDTMDVTEKEKWQQIKQIYKKAGLLDKKKAEVSYVFAKRGTGKKVSRPKGIKGPFRVVDKRMKKDNRLMKQNLKNSKKGKRKTQKGKQGKGKL